MMSCCLLYVCVCTVANVFLVSCKTVDDVTIFRDSYNDELLSAEVSTCTELPPLVEKQSDFIETADNLGKYTEVGMLSYICIECHRVPQMYNL